MFPFSHECLQDLKWNLPVVSYQLHFTFLTLIAIYIYKIEIPV